MTRKRDTVQEIAAKDLAPCDPSSVAPLNSAGAPDLYNYMPTRLVPRAEAKARGWPLFYEATPCRYGHTAPRYTSNERLCVDCKREKSGKAPIGGKTGAEWKPAPRKQPETPAPLVPVTTTARRAPEPDAQEKKFLVALADVRDFDKASALIGVNRAHMLARLSWSGPFKQAVAELTQRLGIPMPVPETGPFEWDEDKRTRLISVWIDTGLLATALDAIRVTPSEFFREAKRNQAFAVALDEAEKLALKTLEWRAEELANAGNDKLLTLILKAKDPKYKDSLNVNMNVMDRFTDSQLRAQLMALRSKQGVIDGEFTVARNDDAGSDAQGAADPAGDSTENLPKHVRDLL
jgi:hypothetical protein